jgi:hypothetical protein
VVLEEWPTRFDGYPEHVPLRQNATHLGTGCGDQRRVPLASWRSERAMVARCRSDPITSPGQRCGGSESAYTPDLGRHFLVRAQPTSTARKPIDCNGFREFQDTVPQGLARVSATTVMGQTWARRRST